MLYPAGATGPGCPFRYYRVWVWLTLIHPSHRERFIGHSWDTVGCDNTLVFHVVLAVQESDWYIGEWLLVTGLEWSLISLGKLDVACFSLLALYCQKRFLKSSAWFKQQCLKSVDLNKKYLYYCIILDYKTVLLLLLLLLLLLQYMGPYKQAGVGTWCKQACMGPVHACMHGSIGHGHRHAGIWQSRSIWTLASPPVTCCITTIATALPAAATLIRRSHSSMR